MHEFDGLRRGVDPQVFVSEYAVVEGGGQGNLKVSLPFLGLLSSAYKFALQLLNTLLCQACMSKNFFSKTIED